MTTTITKIITFTGAMIIATFTTYAQVSKVWATIAPNAVPTEINGQLVSSEADFNQVISTLNITNIERALPSSRSINLINVYEITCNCEEADLI